MKLPGLNIQKMWFSERGGERGRRSAEVETGLKKKGGPPRLGDKLGYLSLR